MGIRRISSRGEMRGKRIRRERSGRTASVGLDVFLVYHDGRIQNTVLSTSILGPLCHMYEHRQFSTSDHQERIWFLEEGKAQYQFIFCYFTSGSMIAKITPLPMPYAGWPCWSRDPPGYASLVLARRLLACFQLIQVPSADSQAALILIHALAERADLALARARRHVCSIAIGLLSRCGLLCWRFSGGGGPAAEEASHGVADGRSDGDTGSGAGHLTEQSRALALLGLRRRCLLRRWVCGSACLTCRRRLGWSYGRLLGCGRRPARGGSSTGLARHLDRICD